MSGFPLFLSPASDFGLRILTFSLRTLKRNSRNCIYLHVALIVFHRLHGGIWQEDYQATFHHCAWLVPRTSLLAICHFDSELIWISMWFFRNLGDWCLTKPSEGTLRRSFIQPINFVPRAGVPTFDCASLRLGSEWPQDYGLCHSFPASVRSHWRLNVSSILLSTSS